MWFNEDIGWEEAGRSVSVDDLGKHEEVTCQDTQIVHE